MDVEWFSFGEDVAYALLLDKVCLVEHTYNMFCVSVLRNNNTCSLRTKLSVNFVQSNQHFLN